MKRHLSISRPAMVPVIVTQFFNCATCGMAGIMTSVKRISNCPKCGDRICELGHDH